MSKFDARAGMLAASLFALAAAGAVAQFFTRMMPDIGVLLFAGEAVLDGAAPYIDVIDINPPLIIWINAVAVLLARTLGIEPITAYRCLVTVFAVVSLAGAQALLGKVLQRLDDRSLVLGMLAFALFALPIQDFGQREHLALAGSIPYVLLAACRLSGDVPGYGRATLIGLMAAVGIAVKPHFALLVIGREVLVAYRRRAMRLTWEGGVVVACGALYIAAVVLAAPEYLDMARWLAGPYNHFLKNPLAVTALLSDGAAIALAGLLIATALSSQAQRPALLSALAVSTAAFYLAAVLQQKGFRYHFLPALALGWLLTCVSAWQVRRVALKGPRRAIAIAAALLGMFVVVSTVAATVGRLIRPDDGRFGGDPDLPALVDYVREVIPDGTLIVLSSHPASSFPLVNLTGVQWGSRFPHLWPLAAAYDSALRSPLPMRIRDTHSEVALASKVRSMVIEDLYQRQPGLVLVLRRLRDEPKWYSQRFDYLEFFNRDADFVRWFDDFEHAATIGKYDAYLRRSEGGRE